MFAFLEQLLETEEVAVYTLAIGGVGDVGDVLLDSGLQLLSAFFRCGVRACHSIREGDRFLADGTACLSTSLLEAAGGS